MNLIPWRNKRNGNEIQKTSWGPNLSRFRSDVDHLFDTFFEDPFSLMREPMAGFGNWVPSLDMVETDKEVTVKAELPGVDPKDLDIRISGNVLTLSGDKNESTEEKGDGWYHSERRFGTFRRSVQLPGHVDPDKVSAEHANGVLTIRFKKSGSDAPKRVPVKVSRS